MQQKHTRAFFLVAACAALLVVSCSTIWGFEDAIDGDADGGGGTSSSSGTSSSGGSSGSSGSDGASSGGPPGVEPAPDAPGVDCVPRPPEGFQGPLAILEKGGTPLPTLEPCPDRYTPTFDLNAKPIAPLTGCSCACDTGQITCSDPTLNFFSEATCTTACGPKNQIAPATACTPFDAGACGATRFMKITDAVPKGSCTPRVVGVPVANVWSAEARLCQPASGIVATCPPTKVPAPVINLPYAAGNYCIASRNASSCPELFPVARTYYDPGQVTDTRKCKTDCTCGSPSGACGGVVQTFDNASACSGGVQTFPLPLNCDSPKASNTGMGYRAPDGGVAVGPITCASDGGGVEGALTPTAPFLVCCRL